MQIKPTRPLAAVTAALGLVAAMAAIPVAAATCAATSASAVATASQEAAVGFARSFTCADLPDAGSWSISVDVTNESDADVTISAIELIDAAPRAAASAGAGATLTSDTLPVTVAAGASATFGVTGEHVLAQVGTESLLNVHLTASGDADGAPVMLAINVHLLGPDTDLDEAEAATEAEARATIAEERSQDGAPDWLPGPPPWVIDLIAALHPDGPPGASIFGGASADAASDATAGADDSTDVVQAGAAAGSAGRAGADVSLPAQAAAEADAAVGGSADADADDDGAGVTVEISAGASGEIVAPGLGGGE